MYGSAKEISLTEFLDFCYDRTYDGKVMFTCLHNGYMKTVSSVRVSELAGFAAGLYISRKCDYYIAQNPSKDYTRAADSLFALDNIVIDIDCHNKSYSQAVVERKVDETIRVLQQDLFLDGIIPEPNFYHRTGRGLQLWWSFKAHSAVLLDRFEKIRGNWVSKIAQVIGRAPGLGIVKVDLAASQNNVGLVRLPGTVNTKTGTRTVLTAGAVQKYDLLREYDNLDAEEIRMRNSMRRKAAYRRPGTKAEGERRMEVIRGIRDSRGGSAEGMRDIYCLLYYSALRMAGYDDDAFRLLSDFNDGFSSPLTPAKLRNVITTAGKKNGYRFRNQTIIEMLDMTEGEQSAFGFFPSAKKERAYDKNSARDKRRREKREKRRGDILRAYRRGWSMRKIADKLGIDRRTVSKIVSAYKEKIQAKLAAAAEKKKRIAEKVRLARELALKKRGYAADATPLFSAGSDDGEPIDGVPPVSHAPNQAGPPRDGRNVPPGGGTKTED